MGCKGDGASGCLLMGAWTNQGTEEKEEGKRARGVGGVARKGPAPYNPSGAKATSLVQRIRPSLAAPLLALPPPCHCLMTAVFLAVDFNRTDCALHRPALRFCSLLLSQMKSGQSLFCTFQEGLRWQWRLWMRIQRHWDLFLNVVLNWHLRRSVLGNVLR